MCAKLHKEAGAKHFVDGIPEVIKACLPLPKIEGDVDMFTTAK